MNWQRRTRLDKRGPERDDLVRFVEGDVGDSVRNGYTILHDECLGKLRGHTSGNEAVYNLLPHECVLADVGGGRCPEPDRIGVEVEAGLDEGHRRVFHVELIPRSERVVNTVHTKRLEG